MRSPSHKQIRRPEADRRNFVAIMCLLTTEPDAGVMLRDTRVLQ